MTDISPVLEFLSCRTPARWLDAAVQDREALLLDHASLELKAAQQAQRLIWKYGASRDAWKYGAPSRAAGTQPSDEFRGELVNKMSRLAREELRHFEQVVALLDERGRQYTAVSASRYAARLHAARRRTEPGALIDTLLIGAIIEARSCERFASLLPCLEKTDPSLAKFYSTLLRAEARHFEDYLALAKTVGGDEVEERTRELLRLDAELVQSPDTELRFLSGAPLADPPPEQQTLQTP